MTDYKLLCEALRGFIETDPHYIPVMSNASALLYDALPDLNWAGFYIVRPLDAPGADVSAEDVETAAGGVADYVLKDDIDLTEAGEDTAGTVYVSGRFNREKIVLAEGDTVEAHEAELRLRNILFTSLK